MADLSVPQKYSILLEEEDCWSKTSNATKYLSVRAIVQPLDLLFLGNSSRVQNDNVMLGILI
jgi:hypothetical protein